MDDDIPAAKRMRPNPPTAADVEPADRIASDLPQGAGTSKEDETQFAPVSQQTIAYPLGQDEPDAQEPQGRTLPPNVPLVDDWPGHQLEQHPDGELVANENKTANDDEREIARAKAELFSRLSLATASPSHPLPTSAAATATDASNSISDLPSSFDLIPSTNANQDGGGDAHDEPTRGDYDNNHDEDSDHARGEDQEDARLGAGEGDAGGESSLFDPSFVEDPWLSCGAGKTLAEADAERDAWARTKIRGGGPRAVTGQRGGGGGSWRGGGRGWRGGGGGGSGWEGRGNDGRGRGWAQQRGRGGAGWSGGGFGYGLTDRGGGGGGGGSGGFGGSGGRRGRGRG